MIASSRSVLSFRSILETNQLVVVAAVIFLLAARIQESAVVNGQEIIGTDICFCQPVVYKLRLDFSLECGESTVNETIPGILETSCLVESRDTSQNLTDPFPTVISEIQILELDQDFQIVGQTVYTEQISNGDIIEYTSIVATSPDLITPQTLPQGFQITIQALNSLEEPLTQTIAILYSNDCGIFPLITEGQQIGWSIFVELGDPPQDFCPLSPGPALSDVPTPAQGSPTISPSASPSANPFVSPTSSPSIAGSDDGTDEPTIAPTFSQSDGFTDVPTSAPTVRSSDDDTKPPAIAPEITCAPTNGEKKKKNMNKKDSKNRDENGERSLRVGSRPTSTPTALCPEPTDPTHNDDVTIKEPQGKTAKKKKDKNNDKGGKKDGEKKKKEKKKKVKEDRHDPTVEADDDVY